jgi:integrase
MRGHIQTRSRDLHFVVIERGVDTTGKRKRDTYTIHGSKREAQKFLTERLAECHDGTYVAPSTLTVEAWLRQWLDGPAKMRVTPKTLQEYRAWAEGRIIPALGRVRLDQLTPAQIQAAWAALLTAPRKDGKRGNGLSPKTIRNCHGLLRTALETAIRHGLLARNPCDLVDLPRARKPDIRVLDADQITTLLGATRGTPLYLPILIAVTTGMRRGEVLALRWVDVDLDGGTLTVARSIEQTKEGQREKETKSGKVRKVTMAALLIEGLRAHREETGRVAGFVLCYEDGSPLSATGLTQRFTRFARTLDLPPVSYHSLRHSAATLLLKQGMSLPEVSAILGHADPAITARVYAHATAAGNKEAAARMDAALRKAMGE